MFDHWQSVADRNSLPVFEIWHILLPLFVMRLKTSLSLLAFTVHRDFAMTCCINLLLILTFTVPVHLGIGSPGIWKVRKKSRNLAWWWEKYQTLDCLCEEQEYYCTVVFWLLENWQNLNVSLTDTKLYLAYQLIPAICTVLRWLNTHRHTLHFNSLFSRTSCVSGYPVPEG